MIYIIGPGHGGPGIVANAYMEGTYSEVYPNIAQDEEGMKRLLQTVLIPRWNPQPCRSRNARNPFTKEANWVTAFRTRTGLFTTSPT